MKCRRFLPVLFAAAFILVPQAPIMAQSAGAPAGFSVWLKGVYDEGLTRGISKKTLDSALTGLSPIKRVIKLDRRQPEFTQTFRGYVAQRANKWRIETGRKRLKTHGELLGSIGKR